MNQNEWYLLYIRNSHFFIYFQKVFCKWFKDLQKENIVIKSSLIKLYFLFDCMFGFMAYQPL